MSNMRWPLMGETITIADRLKMASFCLTAKRFTNSEKVKEFEKEWDKWINKNSGTNTHSLYVSSGSTANFLLVAAVMEKYHLKPGDKVLLPACTWMTNVSPIIQLGLTPIFCDVNMQNYSFDLDEAKAISLKHKDIKLIFITHLLGFPGQKAELREIFPTALIIDDVCESHGCKDSDGKKVGTNSLGATFSFYFGHHMSTIEGGMVTTTDSDLYDLMRMKRSHGLARESIHFSEYAHLSPEIDPQFIFQTDGYNFRNHEVCAVLGLSQLKRLDNMIARRRSNYEDYCRIIYDNSDLFYPHDYEKGNSSFCFPFICKNKNITQRMKSIFKDKGIEYRPVVAGNLLSQPFLKKYKMETTKETPNAQIIHSNGVYIGNNHFVTGRDMNFLAKIIKDI
jgi:CDP-6-deoxy-D-xylo-4-hexulose-3-dehydrase